jgi:hypothetical protein
MSIADALAALPPGPGTHTVPADTARVQLDAAKLDDIAGVYKGVTVTGATLPDGGVRAWADGVAGRVRGLLEPLKVIEVDTTRDAAVLRSDEPAVSGGVAKYYEVNLDGTGTATVNRYQADRDAGTRREPVGFALTHEVTGRLVDDILG